MADASFPSDPFVPADGTVRPLKPITNSIGMKLVLIPSGEFAMGSPDTGHDAKDDEKPQHRVRITRPFYLGATEVTVGQFRRVVETAGYQTEAEKDGKGGDGWNAATGRVERGPQYTWRNPGFAQTDEHPVVNVSWNDAIAYCNLLSEMEGLKREDGYRLPTEAEWEYACRAGTTTRYYYGDAARPSEFASFGGSSKGKTYPAGGFRPNAFNLYDMHGNVWEWCQDWYKQNYYGQSPRADPAGPLQAACRVIRGGSWNIGSNFARSGSRRWDRPDGRSCTYGFRLVRGPVPIDHGSRQGSLGRQD